MDKMGYHRLERDKKGLYLPLIKILGITIKRQRLAKRDVKPVSSEIPHAGPCDYQTIEDRFPDFWNGKEERANAFEVINQDQENFVQFYQIHR